MNHFDDAKALVEHAANEISKLEQAYNNSLSQPSIQPTLKIEIKNTMENLRSALDFAARGLFDKYGSSTKSKPKIYFPYATLSQTQSEFQKSNQIETAFRASPRRVLTLSQSSSRISTIRMQKIAGYPCSWI